ncbi:hypothetical protein EAH89_16595 [Roseomonas nepalensis]|uniref:Uncharacterized protein n=1 Tax=Muricoccus nepalensis TaxID=1854500 RepID=A0A502FUY4_9PROT|nr:hypothetical protein [Roseomonas nepalensis]TPG53368.1 hypothetical protein EAH89_16595 [Roseomonas nepalensis]
MIVYGDAPRPDDPRRLLDAVAASLREVAAAPPGLARHAALVAALIEAGELAQGLADAAFAERGEDREGPVERASMAFLGGIAAAVLASQRSGFARTGPLPAAPSGLLLPARILRKRAEGFAHYALYPEAYALAASALPSGSWRVIGLRSIGTALGAVVAAALGAAPAVTLRPVGHPFHREVRLSANLAANLLADPAARLAVVDEGPGLSGSSFGAVLDALGARGVEERRIHLLPSHGGAPGPQAGEAARARWGRLARHPAPVDRFLLDPAAGLPAWAAARLGPAEAPLEEVSGGGWRRRRFPDPAAWPPVHPYLERRKFLHRSGGATWLLKFVGLGRHGEEAAALARRLHGAGFTPPVAGLLHGFLAERWEEGARPLDPAAADRPALVAHLGRYLTFRAHHLPAGEAEGAPLAALWEMARHNTAEALGEDAAAGLDAWKPRLPALAARGRRVRTDNRLHAWEWLVLPGGRLLKADAVDHAAAHDLVGCQDIAWDVAGAAVELDLSMEERERLRALAGAEAGLTELFLPLYRAFQLGYHAMAADAWGGGEEAERARRAVARYAEGLRPPSPPG